ncbi:glycosyltransferase family 4 protein [Cellulomonas sp. NS3]|uniref:glycosyltransferase family 4 protein n=1 Tax=Cellulomonas sp. NS3 TaxID=2973977 RepID=UPI002163F640|nr:glycosyltransferase family 1 protein [Cellulomonas sp. NS3]
MTVEQCWHAAPGGSGTYIARLTEALAPFPDLEVAGVAARHAGAPDPDFAPTLDRLDHAPLPRQALYEAWNRLGRPRAEALARGPVDVVHATTWAVPPTRRPLVVTVHDLAFLTEPETFTPRGVAYFRRALERVRREADLVVVPSSLTRDACVAEGLDEARVRLVPHGVDMPPVGADQLERFRRTHGLTRPYVLWCGTHEPRKNLPGVLAGFAHARRTVPSLDLVLVGPAGWGDQSRAGQDDPAIHWLGRLSREDLATAYAGAAAFCYPSLAEGFGLPVVEAMAYGVPVVTSVRTPMQELVGAAGVAVEPRDPEAVGAALVSVLRDREHLAPLALAQAGALTWEVAARATAEVYAELV